MNDVKSRVRWAFERLRFHASTSRPPPEGSALESGLYGASQPLLGVRVLLRDPELLREAMTPVLWLAAFCFVYAMLQGGHTPHAHAKSFYEAFALLAPVPSILFAGHYARLAALARWRLGFGACAPREMSLWRAARHALQQALLVAASAAPFALLGHGIGHALAGVLALHWIVVEAFDDARVLHPGESLDEVERAAEAAQRPWFVRGLHHLAERLPIGERVVHAFARVLDRLAKPWREEIALLEQHPALTAGFGVATALLLSVPVVNLFFRPIIVIASSHLLGHLERTEAAPSVEEVPLEETGVPLRVASR